MPAAKTQPQNFRAKDSTSGDLDGEPFVINPRDIFAADHPLVRARPELFEPVEPNRQRPAVEQMTQAPGEKRGEH